MHLIDIKKLSKSYYIYNTRGNIIDRIFNRNKKEIKALKEFDMNIKQGEIVGILGQNGAGKTTLIKMMTGILTPSKGEIKILGYSPQKDRYKYSYSIGVVLGQKSLLWYNIPVIESFKLYKSIYEINDEKFEKRLEKFNDIFQIKELMHVPVRKLSLGQRMKCEIVAALLHDPKVLFLDEPTIGLDVVSKEQIHNFLIQLNQELKTTIIITTHNLEDVERMCNRVIIVEKGEKIYDGNKEKLLMLDDRKNIVVKGKIDITKDIEQMLVNQSEGRYEFSCSKDEVNDLWGKIGQNKDITDIEIKNTNLESIIYKIYKGEVSL